MLPRPAPLLLALLCGLLITPLLTLQAYWPSLPEPFRARFPAGFSSLLALGACSLSLLLYPLVGLVYTLLDRRSRAGLASKMTGASLAAVLLAAAQFGLGRAAARFLGADPTNESQAALDMVRSLFGPTATAVLTALGAATAVLMIALLASLPALIDELAIRPKSGRKSGPGSA